MRLETYSVARAVNEELPESRGSEMVPGDRIDALAGHTGAHSSACRALGALQLGVGA